MGTSGKKGQVLDALSACFKKMKENGEIPALSDPHIRLSSELGMAPAELMVHIRALGREGKINCQQVMGSMVAADPSVSLRTAHRMVTSGGGSKAVGSAVQMKEPKPPEAPREELSSEDAWSRIDALEGRIRELEEAKRELERKLELSDNKRRRLKEDLQAIKEESGRVLAIERRRVREKDDELVALRTEAQEFKERSMLLSPELSQEVRARMSANSSKDGETDGE